MAKVQYYLDTNNKLNVNYGCCESKRVIALLQYMPGNNNIAYPQFADTVDIFLTHQTLSEFIMYGCDDEDKDDTVVVIRAIELVM